MSKHLKSIPGSIVSPKGFLASGVFCDIKRLGTAASAGMDFEVPATQELLHGFLSVPIAGKPQSTVLVPDRHGNRVGAAGAAIVGHLDLKGGVAVEGHGRERVGDVSNGGLSVEGCPVSGEGQ
jgi:hypothetical protein